MKNNILKEAFRKLCRHYVQSWIAIVAICTILCTCMTESVSVCFITANAKTVFSKLQPLGIMATAVNKKVVVSWETVEGADGYEVYEAISECGEDGTVAETEFVLVKDTKNSKVVLSKKQRGNVYNYYVLAYQIEKDNGQADKANDKTYSKASKEVSTTIAPVGKSTIKNFLQTAISPIGSTMYVWGGGWNKADTGAGPGAIRIGLSATWRAFADKQTASYNYANYRYKINKGLDCSGFVGWSVYNVLNTKKGQKGYVYSSKKQAKQFAALGFGSYRTAKKVSDYKAGDIMSSTCSDCGHVWIVLGQCKDGSVVLVHASPSGVQISGTVNAEGKKNSSAYKLAKQYMEKYYPAWTDKYPTLCKNSSYLTHYSQMRWTTEGDGVVLSDPDGYQNMSAKKVLEDLFQ